MWEERFFDLPNQILELIKELTASVVALNSASVQRISTLQGHLEKNYSEYSIRMMQKLVRSELSNAQQKLANSGSASNKLKLFWCTKN